MRNFIKIFGIIALVAAIGFSMAACDSGGGGGGNNNSGDNGGRITWTFSNLSTVNVNVTCAALNPSDFLIKPGDQKTATSSESVIGIIYTPGNVVMDEDGERHYVTFRNP